MVYPEKEIIGFCFGLIYLNLIFSDKETFGRWFHYIS